jgi:tRNA(Ile)-lysidine synthase
MPAPGFTVLTVDHGLRPESAGEATQVTAWSRGLGFAHVVLEWQGDKPASGLQAKAREARYTLMTEWCRGHGVPLLMTGHTMDDQAETVAMRLQRTSTAASLAGVWKERDWNGITLYRPLLGLRREELRSHLVSCGQGWIDDPSNEMERYERVRVRRALKASAEDEVPRLARQAEAAATRVAEVQAAARGWSESHLHWRTEGYAVIDRPAFTGISAEVQQAVLASLLDALAGNRAAPGALANLADWVRQGGAPRRCLGGVMFALRKSTLLAGREPARIPRCAVELPETGSLLWDHRFMVEGAPGTRVRPASGKGSPLAPEAPVPRFVRDGWPLAIDAEGQPVHAKVTFRPCLR